MMSVAFRKVWRTLWNNKGRTLLVVLSIAAGVMAVGMILTSNLIISRQLNAALQTDHLPQVGMSLGGLTDDETIDILAELPEVDQMEGYLQAAIRWKPALEAERQGGTLIAVADYKHMAKAENRRQNDAAFAIITSILQVMTVLMAVVGSQGLSDTLSINVLERRREIGVMRAGGASSFDVAPIFMGEGLLLGRLIWAQAVSLSYIGGKFFVDALGSVFDPPFLYAYFAGGAAAWLVIITVLVLVASRLPARRATQITVRESLACE